MESGGWKWLPYGRSKTFGDHAGNWELVFSRFSSLPNVQIGGIWCFRSVEHMRRATQSCGDDSRVEYPVRSESCLRRRVLARFCVQQVRRNLADVTTCVRTWGCRGWSVVAFRRPLSISSRHPSLDSCSVQNPNVEDNLLQNANK